MFPRLLTGGLVGLLSASMLTAPALAGEGGQRPFDIRDSIEMTVLNDANSSMLRSSNIELSPDGRWFFVITRKGNLATGANDFVLTLFDADEVRRGIPAAGLPKSRSMARFSSTSNRNGIAEARWMSDSRGIAFIGENAGEVPQLYLLDVASGKLDKLTSHPTPVTGFDLRPGVADFIYSAEDPADPADRVARGYEVGKSFMLDVMRGRPSFSKTTAFFVGSRKGKGGERVRMAPLENAQQSLWLSPKGRYAIFPKHLAGPDLSWWQDYDPVRRPPFDKANDPSVTSFSTANPSVFLQYHIIDLKTGEIRPLIDAPTGFLFGGVALDVNWSSDEKTVILSNTFLPLKDSKDPDELARRKASPSIVEFDLQTGRYQRIIDLLAPRGGQPAPMRPFGGSRLTVDGDLVVDWNVPGGSQALVFRKGEKGWAEISGGTPRKSSEGLSVTVVQALDQPPELRATDLETGKSEIITDLNPQFSRIAMGSVEVMKGQDEDGRPWQGGLLKPLGYEAGKRYPLVIQTHGFDPNSFLLDGPFSSTGGYAARALAAKGMMVLQLQDAPPPYGTPDEPVTAMKGVKAAIKALDEAGLIDRKRIGIHGFSRTGLVVQEALVNSGVDFAAATIADANSRGVLNYLWGFGGGYPAMMDTEWLMGAPLWGDENARLWAERDPVFHLSRVRAPLKIDAYSAPTWFDAYAILRRHQKPVEYWAYPDSTHNPVKPWQRLTTQGGNVDWYDFWLNGREDADPAKAAQYHRWRQLKSLRDADRGN